MSHPLAATARGLTPTFGLETHYAVEGKPAPSFLIAPQLYLGFDTRLGHVGVVGGAQMPVGDPADPFDYRIVGLWVWEPAARRLPE